MSIDIESPWKTGGPKVPPPLFDWFPRLAISGKWRGNRCPAVLHAVPADRRGSLVGALLAIFTFSPRAVTQSTRPPAVTTCPSWSAVPAWKTCASSPKLLPVGRP